MFNSLKKSLFFIILIPLAYVIGCIVYAKCTYYNPQTVEIISSNALAPKISQREFSALIWNIGYCGLGEKSDFFYDGGKMMRPTESDLQIYFEGMMNELKEDTVDFQILQEVDSHSTRSYFTDEVSFVRAQSHQANPYSHFAKNYSVNYIPQPWLEPMGEVNSGLLSLAKYEPYRVERHQLPGEFGFPKQLFFLRRCLLVQYFHLDNGKDFVLINIHNSAYDDDGKLKSQEMNYLKDLLNSQTKHGNYVLCGGDWNQCPPNFKYNRLASGLEGDYFQTNVDAHLASKGSWSYDSTQATNRKNSTAYHKGKTFTTVIDFYWHSDNISVTECRGISNEFKYSDHQPVYLKFKIND